MPGSLGKRVSGNQNGIVNACRRQDDCVGQLLRIVLPKHCGLPGDFGFQVKALEGRQEVKRRTALGKAEVDVYAVESEWIRLPIVDATRRGGFALSSGELIAFSDSPLSQERDIGPPRLWLSRDPGLCDT